MSSSLSVAVMQSSQFWLNTESNIKHFRNQFEKLNQVDLVLLPEMFNTSFTMEVEKITKEDTQKAKAFLIEMAKEHQVAVFTSIITEENGRYYNRGHFVHPNGNITNYDKRHLFRMAGEHKNFSAGNKRVIIDYKSWKINLQICYDLRFPVWSRNQENYDVTLYVANWPAARAYPWSTLLKARAIENQCYIIGCNRVGQDGNNIDYSGNSVIIDAKGTVLIEAQDAKEEIIYASLDKNKLNDFRDKFPVALDADKFEIKY